MSPKEYKKQWRERQLEKQGRRPRSTWLNIVETHLGIPRRRKYQYVTAHYYQPVKTELTNLTNFRAAALRVVLSPVRMNWIKSFGSR